nr:cancer-related nucleoside-triphosphatase homolog [Ipomoea batatas]
MAAPGKCFLVTGPPGVGKTTLIIKVLESLRSSNPNLKLQGFYTREIREGTQRVGFEVVTLDGRKGLLASNKISRILISEWKCLASLFIGACSRNLIDGPHCGRDTGSMWASFESLALPELQVKEDTDLFIIDEVGKMELYSSSFFPAVLKNIGNRGPHSWLLYRFQRLGEIFPGGITCVAYPDRCIIYTFCPVPFVSLVTRSPNPSLSSSVLLGHLKLFSEFDSGEIEKNHPGAAIFTLNPSNRDAIKEHIYSLLSDQLQKNIRCGGV